MLTILSFVAGDAFAAPIEDMTAGEFGVVAESTMCALVKACHGMTYPLQIPLAAFAYPAFVVECARDCEGILISQ